MGDQVQFVGVGNGNMHCSGCENIKMANEFTYLPRLRGNVVLVSYAAVKGEHVAKLIELKAAAK